MTGRKLVLRGVMMKFGEHKHIFASEVAADIREYLDGDMWE